MYFSHLKISVGHFSFYHNFMIPKSIFGAVKCNPLRWMKMLNKRKYSWTYSANSLLETKDELVINYNANHSKKKGNVLCCEWMLFSPGFICCDVYLTAYSVSYCLLCCWIGIWQDKKLSNIPEWIVSKTKSPDRFCCCCCFCYCRRYYVISPLLFQIIFEPSILNSSVQLYTIFVPRIWPK